MRDAIAPEPNDPVFPTPQSDREFDRYFVESGFVKWTERNWAEARDHVEDVGVNAAGRQLEQIRS